MSAIEYRARFIGRFAAAMLPRSGTLARLLLVSGADDDDDDDDDGDDDDDDAAAAVGGVGALAVVVVAVGMQGAANDAAFCDDEVGGEALAGAAAFDAVASLLELTPSDVTGVVVSVTDAEAEAEAEAVTGAGSGAAIPFLASNALAAGASGIGTAPVLCCWLAADAMETAGVTHTHKNNIEHVLWLQRQASLPSSHCMQQQPRLEVASGLLQAISHNKRVRIT